MWLEAQEFRWQDPLILRSCVFWAILSVSNCVCVFFLNLS